MKLSWIFPTCKRAWFWLMMRMIFLIVIPISALLFYMMDIPGKSFQGQLEPITAAEKNLADNMLTHVRAIASKEHNTLHPLELEKAARYIETQLADMGYFISKSILSRRRATDSAVARLGEGNNDRIDLEMELHGCAAGFRL